MKKRKICVSRILKMTSLFFLSCAMFAQAETESSQSIRITLNKNNVRLENILNDIESQTNLLFIYNKNVNVNRKVSVNAENTSLQEVLQTCSTTMYPSKSKVLTSFSHQQEQQAAHNKQNTQLKVW